MTGHIIDTYIFSPASSSAHTATIIKLIFSCEKSKLCINDQNTRKVLKSMQQTKIAAFTDLRPHKLPKGFTVNGVGFMKLEGIIKEQIIKLIEDENVRHFISGMAMGIDMLCAERILNLKEQYPDIKLECALPCEDQPLTWPQAQWERYFKILDSCDQKTLISKEYTDTCMMDRNKYMVDKTDFLIAVWNGTNGGTANTVFYARQNGKPIIIINPKTFEVDNV